MYPTLVIILVAYATHTSDTSTSHDHERNKSNLHRAPTDHSRGFLHTFTQGQLDTTIPMSVIEIRHENVVEEEIPMWNCDDIKESLDKVVADSSTLALRGYREV